MIGSRWKGHGTRLIRKKGDIDACTDFKMLKVKVPIISLGAWGSRYVGMDVIHIQQVGFDLPNLRFHKALGF